MSCPPRFDLLAVRCCTSGGILRRQQGKIEGKTGCAWRDELSEGWLRESDLPVRDWSGSGATTGRGPQARRLLVRNARRDPPRRYSLGLFKGVDARVVHGLWGRIIREEGLPYQSALFENAPRKCSLVGYWQCEKYFFGLRHELRERLLPREPLPARSIATEPAILDAGERSVLVHVRRTDYVGNPYHGVLPMEYYREAAALIAAKVADPVFLFSRMIRSGAKRISSCRIARRLLEISIGQSRSTWGAKTPTST